MTIVLEAAVSTEFGDEVVAEEVEVVAVEANIKARSPCPSMIDSGESRKDLAHKEEDVVVVP